MPPLEAWQKVFVSQEFLQTAHGKLGCTTCHGGSREAQKMEDAHSTMVADPGLYAESNCDPCHQNIGANHQMSLHASLAGYLETLRVRTGQSTLSPELTSMFEMRCAGCHTTCGQCHISRPNSANGGFNDGHVFAKRPSMTLNCTACHGSRVGEEFRGQHAGIVADAHYNRGMQCVACHPADEVHNADPTAKHRYEVVSGPRCEQCHQIGTENSYHALHKDKLSCQVCHSQSYKNCYNCHVGKTTNGLTQPSELDFKVGRNTLQSASRPYNYVVVRHAPIAPNSYDDFAAGQMVNFAALPTWKYATPHNIQKRTPQTENCTSSCHNNRSIFLTSDDLQKLSAEEQAANKNVVVDTIPQ